VIQWVGCSTGLPTGRLTGRLTGGISLAKQDIWHRFFGEIPKKSPKIKQGFVPQKIVQKFRLSILQTMDFQQMLKKVLQKQRDLVKAAILLHIPPAALNFRTSLGGLPQKFGSL